MDYKPSDFFVGVIDVFAILLPGSLLAFATQDLATQYVLGGILPPVQGDIQSWVAFFFAAYLLGHFIFLIGSFLDSLVYDRYRKRFLVRNNDELYRCATAIKQRQLQPLTAKEIVNTFKWARAKIQLAHPALSIEISRLEADSKFFRSLIVVLLIIAGTLLLKAAWVEIGVCLALAVLAFFRYADQRYKSTELAYIYLVAMDKSAENTHDSSTSPTKTNGPKVDKV